MEFTWEHIAFSLEGLTEKEIEESFEDPFSIRIMPEMDEQAESRFFNLGKSSSGKGLFSVFWTDGKRYRVVFSRLMTPEETNFYDRKNSELTN